MHLQSQQANSHPIRQFFIGIMDKVGRQNFGLILMIISQIIWPLSFVYPSENGMNPFETNLSRSVFTMLSHFWLVKWFNLNYSLKSSHNLKVNLRRNMIVVLHQLVLTGSLFVLPFPIVFTLNSSCVLFVFVLDYYLFNVQINGKQVQGVILGFLGVLLTVNGQFMVDLLYPDFQKETEFKHYITDDAFLKLLTGLGLVGINFARAYALCISKMLRGVTGLQLSFHFGLILMFQCSIFYPCFVTKPVDLSVMAWSVIYCAIPQNIVQILFLTAIILSKNTGLTNLMCFVSIAVGYFISLIRYEERLNVICLGGVMLILAGLIKTIYNRQSHQK